MRMDFLFCTNPSESASQLSDQVGILYALLGVGVLFGWFRGGQTLFPAHRGYAMKLVLILQRMRHPASVSPRV